MAVRGSGWSFFGIGPALLVTAGLVLLLDQISKAWVRAVLQPYESVPFLGPLNLTYITNTGAAFGILPNQTALLTIVAVVVSGVILFYARSTGSRSRVLQVSLGLQLGGAIGNLIDRVWLGSVTDFFDLQNAAGANIWPVFNVADSAIVVGVVVLAVYLLFFDRQTKPAPAPADVALTVGAGGALADSAAVESGPYRHQPEERGDAVTGSDPRD